MDSVKRAAGTCLFCRNTKIRASSADGVPKCSKTAVKLLLRYLDMEVTKLFDDPTFLEEEGPDDEGELRFELIVLSMCGTCRTVTNDFWEVYLQLEQMSREVSSAVEVVGRQMKRLESRNNAMTIGDLLNAAIDDKLRAEVLGKCNRRIIKSSRVSLNDIKEPETSAASSSMSSTSRLSTPAPLSLGYNPTSTPTPKRSPDQETPSTPKMLMDQKASKSQKKDTPEKKVTTKRERANDVDDVNPSQEIKQHNAGGGVKRRRIQSESNIEASDDESEEEEYAPRVSTRLDEDDLPPPILIELSNDQYEPINEQPVDMDDNDTDGGDESRLNIDDLLSSVDMVASTASPGCFNSGAPANGSVGVVVACCKLCNKDFGSFIALNRHIKQVHSGRGNFQFQCQKCFDNYSGRSELRRHEMSAHMMELFIKPLEQKLQLIIGKTTERQLMWILDRQTRPAEGGKAFQCTHCPQKYPARAQIYLHLNFRHLGEILTDLEIQKAMVRDEDEQEEEPDPNGFPRDGDYPHTCSLCNRGFNLKCALQRHERTQHMLETFKPQLPPGTQEEELKTAVEIVTKQDYRQTGKVNYPFGCPYCERNIRSATDLKIHILNAHFQNVITQLVAVREGTAQADVLNNEKTDGAKIYD